MILTEYKDLKVGDHIKYQGLSPDRTKKESGEGTVRGFGLSGLNWFVWITDKNTEEIKFIPYEDVKKASI